MMNLNRNTMAVATPVQIHEKVDNIDYPATKQQLIKYAMEHGNKNKEVIEVLHQIPEKEYGSPIEVSNAIDDVLEL